MVLKARSSIKGSLDRQRQTKVRRTPRIGFHAIKIILPDLVGNDPMLATRFRQEALAAAAIRHQNIIAVTDFGIVRGNTPFLVMEFIRGRSLQEILTAEGAMKAERAWELITPVAAGVAAAHRQNIIHRDLKPLNIMVQQDEIGRASCRERV